VLLFHISPFRVSKTRPVLRKALAEVFPPRACEPREWAVTQIQVSLRSFGRRQFRPDPRDYEKEFYAAIRVNDLTTVRALLKSASVDTRDKRGATPLMYAAAIGSTEGMKLLLDSWARV